MTQSPRPTLAFHLGGAAHLFGFVASVDRRGERSVAPLFAQNRMRTLGRNSILSFVDRTWECISFGGTSVLRRSSVRRREGGEAG